MLFGQVILEKFEEFDREIRRNRVDLKQTRSEFESALEKLDERIARLEERQNQKSKETRKKDANENKDEKKKTYRIDREEGRRPLNEELTISVDETSKEQKKPSPEEERKGVIRKIDRNGLKKSLKRCSDNLQKRITVLEDKEKEVQKENLPGPEVLSFRKLNLQSKLKTIERQIEAVQAVVKELGQRKRWTEHCNVPLNYICDLCQQSGHIPDYCPAFGKAVERIQECEKSGLCFSCLQPSTTNHRCYRMPCWYCQTASSFYRECPDKYAGENHHRALCILPDLWDNAVDQLRALVKNHNEISSMLEQTEEIQKKRVKWS
ncbi:hypothetical protein WR25_19895 [Diploscapter pachys]|uniref:CCHC-type domain-containing protein n=1 Tax=Diploscapter pachys TaxID=2018661 RepID=A0A2A2LBC4_9BILA|nr:hypothetical protein WR25_19895 [Diploscapter pachys]